MVNVLSKITPLLNQCIDIQASAEADRPLSGSRLRQQHRKARVLQLSDKVHHHPGYLDSGMKIAIATVNAREDSDTVSLKKTAFHSMIASDSLLL